MEASTTRKRRTYQPLLLQVKLKINKSGYTSKRFPTTRAAARFVTAKEKKTQLNFLFNVEALNGEDGAEKPTLPKLSFVIIFIAIFTTFFHIRVVIGVQTYGNISMENLRLRDDDEGEEHISGNLPRLLRWQNY